MAKFAFEVQTTTALTTSASPSTYGDSVTFTATVTAQGSPVTSGTVDFKEGNTVLASMVPLSASGTASFSTFSLSAITHTITAFYSGASTFDASSASVQQIVNQNTALTVNTLADDPSGPTPGYTTLRDAITLADAGTANQYVINFSVEGTIHLTSPLPSLDNNIVLDGPGASRLKVQREPTPGQFSVFAVDSGGIVDISGMTISGGNNASYGGGLINLGTLMVSNSTFSSNSAAVGGGIANLGTATVIDSIFAGNSANNGGGIDSDGTLMVIDSIFTGNSANNFYGGGLMNSGGTATVIGSAFTGNSAIYSGGGIANFSGGLTLTDSNFINNSAVVGGSIYNYSGSTATVTDSIFINNSAASEGGGVFNGGTATVTNSIFANNSAPAGGGIFSYGTLTVLDSTFTSNSALGTGGGLDNYSGGTATLTNCTISGNTSQNGGGIDNGGSLMLNNTIVAGNLNTESTLRTISPVRSSRPARTTSSATVQESPTLPISIPSNLIGTTADPMNPLLGPLADYGGPTQTMALLPGSPAIDAGSNALSIDPTTGQPLAYDQRGLPRIVNGIVDIGACESSGFTVTVTSGSGQSTGPLTAFSAPLVATVTANNPSGPVAGGLVTFTPPPSGASATLSGSPAPISATGTASVTAAANSIVGSYTVSATASGITTPASFSLTNMWVPTFGALTSPTIVYGTSTTTLTGHLGSGTAYPAGSNVSITLNSVTKTASVDGSGDFTTTFSTGSLGVAGGPYTVTYAFAGNSAFTAATDTSTTLTVTAAPLTASIIGDPTKTCDGTTSATLTQANFSLSGLVGAQSFTVTQTVGTYNSKDVTAATTVMASLSPSDFTPGSGTVASNYILPTTASGAGTITPKALTYSGLSVPASKVYDGTTTAVVSGTAALQAAEAAGTGSTADGKPYTVDSVSLTGTPTGTYNSKDVATATTVTFGGLSLTGTGNGDYTLTASTQAATITPRTVTASIVGDPTKTYNGSTSATLSPSNFSLTGVISGESFTVTQTAGTYNSKDVSTATTVTASLSAGNFTPGAGTLASDYTLPTTASGAGNINPALLTVSAANESMTYGGTVPALTYTYTGLVNGDTITTFSGGVTTTATSSSSVGSYSITEGTLATAGNYTIGTFNPGTLTVNAAPLTITANNDEQDLWAR